jgi:type I restriction enzyme S subunit
MVLLRPNHLRADSRYLLFALQSRAVQTQIMWAEGTGSTVSNLRIPDLKKLKIPSPPINKQRAIAHILGTLDDKIELNRRRNQTLEAMARALFKYWFIDFGPVRRNAAKAQNQPSPGLRPPSPRGRGFENTAHEPLPSPPGRGAGGEGVIEGQTFDHLFPDRLDDEGKPEGWVLGSVEDLCSSITSGGTPARKKSIFWDGGTIPWFKTGELQDGPLLDSEEKITETALQESSCKLWPAGTILFALYASPTVGRLGVLTSPATSNQAAAGLIAKESIGVPFLRRALLEAREKLQNIAVGAAQQNINQAILKTHRLALPPACMCAHYSKLVRRWDDQQVQLAYETRTLAQLRDTLLPKLISGELRIADAEKFIERAEI